MLVGVAVAVLNQERSRNALITSLKGVPIVVPIIACCWSCWTFVLGRTAYGRHIYAVGGNREAARRAGINVDRIRISAFVICSTMAAVGGIIAASRANSVDPNTGGSNVLLYAVGAAVIGGTSLFGGKGRVLDAVLGGAVVAVIDNGMGLMGYSAGIKFVVTGLVLLLAAGVDALSGAGAPPRPLNGSRLSTGDMRAGPSQEEIRRHNLGTLLRYVHVHGADVPGRADLELGLNRSTIGALTADLAAAGLVSEEVPRDHGRAGRPSLVVRPESDRVYVYAFSIEVDRVPAARVGLGGVVLDRREMTAPARRAVAAKVVAAAGRVRRARCEKAVPPRRVCVGSRRAVSGIVRQEDGLVRLGQHVGWVDEPLGAALAEALGDPDGARSPVGNGADLARAGRAHPRRRGRLRQRHLPARRRRRRRRHHRRRPAGHRPRRLRRRGRPHGGQPAAAGPCSCGSRGCWETEIGEYALVRAAGRDGTGQRAVLAVSTRPPAATRWPRPRCARSATGSASAWPTWSTSSTRRWSSSAARCATSTSPRRPRCAAGSTGGPAGVPGARPAAHPPARDDAALLGAAELAFERLLADPLETSDAESRPRVNWPVPGQVIRSPCPDGRPAGCRPSPTQARSVRTEEAPQQWHRWNPHAAGQRTGPTGWRCCSSRSSRGSASFPVTAMAAPGSS